MIFLYNEGTTKGGRDVCGTGTLDGNAEAFPNENSIYRPMMLRMLRCRNIRLQELYLYNSPAWTSAFLDSDHIWVSGVRIENHKKNNGDGLDLLIRGGINRFG